MVKMRRTCLFLTSMVFDGRNNSFEAGNFPSFVIGMVARQLAPWVFGEVIRCGVKGHQTLGTQTPGEWVDGI